MDTMDGMFAFLALKVAGVTTFGELGEGGAPHILGVLGMDIDSGFEG
jgi:hypothetical protein